MAVTLTTAQYNTLVADVAFMVKANATELPFDDEVIFRLGAVASAIGFIAPEQNSSSTGAFKEACLLHPISTLIALAAFIGKP